MSDNLITYPESDYDEIVRRLEELQEKQNKEQQEATAKYLRQKAKQEKFNAEHPVQGFINDHVDYVPLVLVSALMLALIYAVIKIAYKRFRPKIGSIFCFLRSIPARILSIVEKITKNMEERKVSRIVRDETIRQIARDEVSKLDKKEIETLRNQISRCIEEGKINEAKDLFALLEKLEKP